MSLQGQERCGERAEEIASDAPINQEPGRSTAGPRGPGNAPPARFRGRIWLSCAALGLVVALTGCDSKPAPDGSAVKAVRTTAPAPAAKVTFSDFPVPERPAVTRELLAQGRRVYEQNCAACHGEKGDGAGQCSSFLLPRPRNFVAASYRLRSTASGRLPTDADLFRAVSLGLAGTPMPPWKWLLNDTDRWAVVEYIKTFSPQFREPDAERAEIVELGTPPPRTDAAVAEGKELYGKLSCASCHGDQGRGDGPSAYSLVDDSNQRIPARDFSKPSGFKAGYATKEIVRTFLTGLNGTPMPSYQGLISQEQAWHLAYYVETLVQQPVVPLARASQGFADREELGEPDVRVRLLERAWKYEPSEIRVKQGQVVEVTFEPTDNGLGAGHGFAVSSYDETAFINGAMVGAPKTVKFRADRPGKFTFYCATQCSTDKLHPLMNGTLIVEPKATQAAN